MTMTVPRVMSGIITGPHFIEYFHAPGSVKIGSMVAVLEVRNTVNHACSINCSLGWRLWKAPFPDVCCQNLTSIAVTSLAAGQVGDVIGRKGTLFIGAVVFTFGGAIQTFATSFGMMVVGRIVSGFGVGLLSCVHPMESVQLL